MPDRLFHKRLIIPTIYIASIAGYIILSFEFLYSHVRSETIRPIALVGLSAGLISLGIVYLLNRINHPKFAALLYLTSIIIGTYISEYNFDSSDPLVITSVALCLIASSIVVTRIRLYVFQTIIIAGFIALPFIQTLLFAHEITINLYTLAKDTLLLICIGILSNQLLPRYIDPNELWARTAPRKLRPDAMINLYRLADFGRLAAGLFHDLINPITHLHLEIRQLSQQDSFKHNLPISESMQRTLHTIEHIDTIVSSVKKQLLQQTTDQWFTIDDEIRAAINLLQYKARKTNSLVHFNPKEPLRLYGNSLKFHHVVVNIISNALDACAEYNSLSDTQPSVTIKTATNDIATTITIADTGCGIKSELLKKIFEPFFTTKQNSEGIGLGLATTKYIIEHDFKGYIWVQSLESLGTVFTITIPHQPKQPK